MDSAALEEQCRFQTDSKAVGTSLSRDETGATKERSKRKEEDSTKAPLIMS
jgi:hypothetical protein